jgi:hypothetical protein
MPWNEAVSLVPALERFLPFGDGYIQRFLISANRTVVAGEPVQTD